MILNNCNHFSNELVRRLFANKKQLPGYINRAAYIGSFLSCLIPFKWVTVGTLEGYEKEVEQ